MVFILPKFGFIVTLHIQGVPPIHWAQILVLAIFDVEPGPKEGNFIYLVVYG